MSAFDPEQVRPQFPALMREVEGRPAVFLDGPAGTQVPQSVVQAVSNYLVDCNANRGGSFPTSRDSDRLLDEAHRTVADFLGAADAETVVFGPNMTSLTFALSRALAQTWRAGDEVVVTQVDHDANITPWVLAARDAGAVVRVVGFNEDTAVDLSDLKRCLSPRTRLVAVGYASNVTGTIQPVAEVIRRARDVGALVFVDAVHYAPHGLIDVERLGCDFLACSAYKFFGPHVGILWGRRDRLESVVPYKLRPAPESLPGRWMTGTQNHEGVAGTAAAIEYLADIGRRQNPQAATRRQALEAAFAAISTHERQLAGRLLDGLAQIPGIRVWGIADPARTEHRVPTVSITHARIPPSELARRLAERGIFTWAGHHYALALSECLGLEPGGTLRLGCVHYNTAAEVDRVLETLAAVVAPS